MRSLRFVGGSFVCTLALTSAANAQVQTPFDNPVIVGDVSLGPVAIPVGAQETADFVVSTNGAPSGGYDFNYFNLEVKQPQEVLPSLFTAVKVTPADATYGPGGTAPWETHGTLLTPGQLLTIEANKIFPDFTKQPINFSASIADVVGPDPKQWTTDPETIVVPINSVVVLPSYTTGNGPQIRQFMEAFTDQRFHDLFWEDKWWSTVVNVSHPNEGRVATLGKWDFRTSLSHATEGNLGADPLQRRA